MASEHRTSEGGDLFSIREVENHYEVLTSIEEPGFWNELAGKYERGETWEPLATLIARAQMLKAPGGEIFSISLADALRSEGWLTPEEAEDAQRV